MNILLILYDYSNNQQTSSMHFFRSWFSGSVCMKYKKKHTPVTAVSNNGFICDAVCYY